MWEKRQSKRGRERTTREEERGLSLSLLSSPSLRLDSSIIRRFSLTFIQTLFLFLESICKRWSASLAPTKQYKSDIWRNEEGKKHCWRALSKCIFFAISNPAWIQDYLQFRYHTSTSFHRKSMFSELVPNHFFSLKKEISTIRNSKVNSITLFRLPFVFVSLHVRGFFYYPITFEHIPVLQLGETLAQAIETKTFKKIAINLGKKSRKSAHLFSLFSHLQNSLKN